MMKNNTRQDTLKIWALSLGVLVALLVLFTFYH